MEKLFLSTYGLGEVNRVSTLLRDFESSLRVASQEELEEMTHLLEEDVKALDHFILEQHKLCEKEFDLMEVSHIKSTILRNSKDLAKYLLKATQRTLKILREKDNTNDKKEIRQ